ncbi:MAG: YbhB/YbcL family Raf kinase inhibitor-like protein [Acidimicrobiia bacterium]|nr:YbhB/YbcL family Raf kinase inhibitor-like protein [Acidimicrobiia bacterium]
MRRWWSALAIVALLAACGDDGGERTEDVPEADVSVELTSPAFGEGETIPVVHTCDGEDVSPPLAWGGLPEGTAELSLIVEDPDAPGGTFVHWVVWGIPTTVTGLEEGSVPAQASQGENSFGSTAWDGPCPPEGDEPHRYVFRLLATSETVFLDEGASADDLLRAIDEMVLAEGELVGRYGR